MMESREQDKIRDKDGIIISCSCWVDYEYCVRSCPDRIGCDVLGKPIVAEDLLNPSRRKNDFYEKC